MSIPFPKTFAIFLLITLLYSCGGDKVPVEENPLIESKAFDAMSSEEKKEVISKLIDGKVNPYKNYQFAIDIKLDNALKSRIKKPETLKVRNPLGNYTNSYYLANDIEVIDSEKGSMKVNGEYQAENAFGVENKGRFQIDFSVRGKKFDLISVDLN